MNNVKLAKLSLIDVNDYLMKILLILIDIIYKCTQTTW